MSGVSMISRARSLPVIADCGECPWLSPCGGFRDTPGLFGNSCFARFCCGGRPDCNYLCPSNVRFAAMMNEVEGLDFESLPACVQRRARLPLYVPSLLHASKRSKLLQLPVAAVPPKAIFHRERGHLRTVATTRRGLREHLKLVPQTRVILNCVQQDCEIERLWEFWVQDDVPHQLARLGIDLVIGPNYSHLRGVPRLESIGNRMRQLICLRDLQQTGMNVVPHLSAVDPADWDWWRCYLTHNPRVQYVAFEFQTGYKNPVEGGEAIRCLAAIQRDVGRPLHLIVIGGTQFLPQVADHFAHRTFIDGSPFWNTIERQRARLVGGQLAWSSSPTTPEETLDELMAHNVGVYQTWIDGRFPSRPMGNCTGDAAPNRRMRR